MKQGAQVNPTHPSGASAMSDSGKTPAISQIEAETAETKKAGSKRTEAVSKELREQVSGHNVPGWIWVYHTDRADWIPEER